jgi:hypothetical protein
MTARTGNIGIGADSVGSAYAASFGSLPSGTKYVDGRDTKSVFDLRPTMKKAFDVQLKALTSQSGGAGTAGYALVPVYVDPRIVDQSRKYTPLTEILPRVTNYGLTADYNVISAKGAAYSAAEDAPLPEANNTYARNSAAIKFLYSVGRVTGPALASIPPYTLSGFAPASGAATISPFSDQSAPTPMQIEVLSKARALKELEENLLLNGSVSTDATQFDGLIVALGTSTRLNVAAGNGGLIALSDIDALLQKAFDNGGRPDLAVCNSNTFRQLQTLLQQKIGYLQASVVNEWGFSEIVINTIVGPLRVIPSMYLSNSAGVGRFLALDTSVIEVRVLQDLTYEELAKTNDSQKFLLKEYITLVVKAPSFCAHFYQIGIAT